MLKEPIVFNKHQKRIFIQRIFLRPLQIIDKLTYNPEEIVNFINSPDTEENQIINRKILNLTFQLGKCNIN